jgi:predicted small metal-binding protein
MKRWACMEVECTATVTAADDDELIEKVNDHVRSAHDSYELDEVILAGAEEVAGAD